MGFEAAVFLVFLKSRFSISGLTLALLLPIVSLLAHVTLAKKNSFVSKTTASRHKRNPLPSSRSMGSPYA